MQLQSGGHDILDMLRGLASQLVLVGHAMSYFGVMKILHPPNFPWIQNIAVVVFFILSGFVITRSVVIRTAESGNNIGNRQQATGNRQLFLYQLLY